MEPKFIRIFDNANDKEVLLNVSAITEIEVEYALPGKGSQKRMGFSVGLREGRNNPEAIRVYHFIVAGKRHSLTASPGSPVTQVLDEIYKKAIKHEG